MRRDLALLDDLHEKTESAITGLDAYIAAGKKFAEEFRAGRLAELERVIELDELYGHDRCGAYLSIVDAHSYAVWATSGPLSVDDESWILLGWQASQAGLR